MPRDVRQLLIMEATGQLINNKASRFISSMYVFFSIPLSQIVFGFRHTRSCQTDCILYVYTHVCIIFRNGSISEIDSI